MTTVKILSTDYYKVAGISQQALSRALTSGKKIIGVSFYEKPFQHNNMWVLHAYKDWKDQLAKRSDKSIYGNQTAKSVIRYI